MASAANRIEVEPLQQLLERDRRRGDAPAERLATTLSSLTIARAPAAARAEGFRLGRAWERIGSVSRQVGRFETELAEGQRKIDTLNIDIYPGSGTSELYEDAGDGYAYQRGEYRRTIFTTAASGQAPHLSVTLAQTGSYVGAGSFRVTVHDVGAQQALVDGRPVRPRPPCPVPANLNHRCPDWQARGSGSWDSPKTRIVPPM